MRTSEFELRGLVESTARGLKITCKAFECGLVKANEEELPWGLGCLVFLVLPMAYIPWLKG